MNPRTVVIELDECDGSALAGRIEAGGEVMPFLGWLGLVATLDRLLCRERETARHGPAIRDAPAD